jgi:glucoamylase
MRAHQTSTALEPVIRGSSIFTRRRFLAAAGATALVAPIGGTAWFRSRHVHVDLYSETAAVTGDNSRHLVLPGRAGDVLPGSRVLRDDPDVSRRHADETAWLAAGSAWARTGPWAGLVRSALLDLRALLLPGGAAVAGWSTKWRYVWPRDAAHVVAALAATGHTDDALPILEFLQRVQRADGWFEARYLPNGSGPPDRRPRQLDGVGWVLWATERLAAAHDAPGAAGVVHALRPMLMRATRVALDQAGRPTGLPEASPDYWEVSEDTLTLGTAAPLLAGLVAATSLFQRIGDDTMSRSAADGAARLGAAIHYGFGRDGYPRHLGGKARDASIAFLLPPYSPQVQADVVTALAGAKAGMRRPAGGYAPGEGWKQDGISWTPETALLALAAASSGDAATAERLLDWLGRHRTAAGSFPEKVLHDGTPAAVAPLSWTAATVVLTAASLQRPPTSVRIRSAPRLPE